MILFGVTLSLIGGLQLFEEPFILTNGNGGTDQQGMTSGSTSTASPSNSADFGGASAMSWMLFALVALLTWLTNRAFGERR
jgi:multiple sugar transport system permease protein